MCLLFSHVMHTCPPAHCLVSKQACAAISHALCSPETKGAFCDAGGISALVRVFTSKAAESDLSDNQLLFEEAGA